MRRVPNVGVVLVLVLAGACGGESSLPTAPSVVVATNSSPAPSPAPTPVPVPAPSPTAPIPPATSGFTVVAVGDIGWRGSLGTPRTAKIIEWLRPKLLLGLGDMAYPSGTDADFKEAYDPFYGPFKFFTRPAPGNHDYETASGGPFYAYFGAQAGPNGQGYYSFAENGWLFLAMNSNTVRGAQSDQVRAARDVLRVNTQPCVVSYWHHPRWTSSQNGDTVPVQPFWDVLSEFRADVVLVGHDHVYERMKPMSANGEPSADGIRQFTVGTGGAPLYGFPNVKPQSEVRLSEFGVLFMDLRPGSYEWWFFADVGARWADHGIAACN